MKDNFQKVRKSQETAFGIRFSTRWASILQFLLVRSHGGKGLSRVLIPLTYRMLQMSDHYLPLHRACARKDIQKVGRMLARDAMVNVNGMDHLKQTPLHIAVKTHCIAIVFQLLDYGGVDLDVDHRPERLLGQK